MLNSVFKFLKKSDLKSIEQRFYEPGHTHSSCDRSFDLINDQISTTETVFMPQMWIDIINQSKKREPRFTVTEMTAKDFFSITPLKTFITSYKIASDDKKIDWSSFQTIIYKSDDPLSLHVKKYYSENDQTTKITFQLNGDLEAFLKTKLKYLYRESHLISKSKFEDLQKLLKYVPPEHHKFFESLKYTNNENYKDYALASRESSDEEEEEEK